MSERRVRALSLAVATPAFAIAAVRLFLIPDKSAEDVLDGIVLGIAGALLLVVLAELTLVPLLARSIRAVHRIRDAHRRDGHHRSA